MGYNNVVMGWYGDEKVVSTSKIGGLPIGTKMELPDGRVFRHCRLGADCATAGYLYQTSVLAVADTMLSASLACNTLTVGATVLNITASGTTAWVKDAYADGFVTVATSTGTGAGYTYKIKANNSAAVGASCAFSLYESDAVKEATAGGTILSIRKSPYDGIVNQTADTVIERVVGVACASAAASTYCWIQTKGIASVKLGASALVVGSLVSCATATAAGAGPVAAGSVAFTNMKSSIFIGVARTSAPAYSYAQVDLTLE